MARCGYRISDFPEFFHIQPAFTAMKADLHPNYQETTITCTCGTVYNTRSTQKEIKIGICAACHPFFTGEQRFVDTAGRVDKFAKRFGAVTLRRTAKPKLAAAGS